MIATETKNPLDDAGRWQRRKLSLAKRRVRSLIIAKERRHAAVRRRLANQYLAGEGLEIGALHIPLSVPRNASVSYVDRLSVPELREHYPELDDYDVVAPDIIDDGERLGSITDSAYDFVIANHMIEHCEDPIGTIQSHLRVLKPGGVIYMAVPDCRYTFDRNRTTTSLGHVTRDHLEGAEWSRREHYEDWALHIDEVAPDQISSRADELEALQYSIHFHVWTPAAFLEMLTACRREFGFPLEVDALERNDHEFIVIIRRGVEQ